MVRHDRIGKNDDATEERKLLQSVVGKRLESYRLNDSDNTSFEIFVLRFQDTDIEIATEEISCGSDWFDETNVVKALERPNRDSWSRVGETKPYKTVRARQTRPRRFML